MATKKEKEQLIEILKFTPRTYKISLWGYGGESVMGTVDRKIYDYFKSRRLDLSDFAWDSDYAAEHNIPEDMWPFPPGSWYECDDMAHINGVVLDSGTVRIEDENGDEVLQSGLEDFQDEDCPEIDYTAETFIDDKPAGTIVFIGNSNEKGTFFEGDIELTAPFDINKLTFNVEDIDGSTVVNGIEYDGIDIDNWGGDTTGKSSEFGFYVAGSLKDGKWERYRNSDDCTYKMTEWFSKKVDPVREGIYEIDTGKKNEWPNTFPTTALWTGTRWIGVWADDTPETEAVKIKQWRGIAYDPDANQEAVMDIRDIMDRVKNLKEFKVVRNVSEEFVLNGKMPYDIKLDKNNVLTVSLMAVDKEEAERRVSEFISGMNDDQMD